MVSSAGARAADGRRLKTKGARTRERMLDELERLLHDTPPMELRMAQIAEASGVGMSTVYSYFDSLDDALFALLSRPKFSYDEPLSVLRRDWTPETATDNAKAFVKACLDLWDAHRPVLQVRNIKSDGGDARFLNLRLSMTMPVLNALAEKVTMSKSVNALPSNVASSAYAAVILAAIERNGAAYRLIDAHSRSDLVDAAAFLLVQWLAPQAPDGSQKAAKKKRRVVENNTNGSTGRRAGA